MSKRKRGWVTVRHADGTTELKHPHSFRKKSPRATLAQHRRTDYWRNLRRKALSRDGNRCTICKGDNHLEVHHLTYERLGRELLTDVTTLCQRCHAKEHQWQARQKRASLA